MMNVSDAHANPVGYPRVRPYSGFAIFDDAVRIVRFHRVAFDFVWDFALC